MREILKLLFFLWPPSLLNSENINEFIVVVNKISIIITIFTGFLEPSFMTLWFFWWISPEISSCPWVWRNSLHQIAGSANSVPRCLRGGWCSPFCRFGAGQLAPSCAEASFLRHRFARFYPEFLDLQKFVIMKMCFLSLPCFALSFSICCLCSLAWLIYYYWSISIVCLRSTIVWFFSRARSSCSLVDCKVVTVLSRPIFDLLP